MSKLRAFLITDPLVILATVLFGSISLITSLFDAAGNRQAAIARVWAHALLVIGRVRVKVEGLEKLSSTGSYVFVSNHSSYMDTPVILATITAQFRFLARKGLFKIPWLGGHLARAGHIPVPRDDPRATVRTMTLAAQTIRERGISLLIFPEGTRSRTGEMGPFKEGAAYIAIKAAAPLVPIALIGTREVLPFGSGIICGGTVTVRISDPIPTAGLTLHDRIRVTEELRSRIAEMKDEQKTFRLV